MQGEPGPRERVIPSALWRLTGVAAWTAVIVGVVVIAGGWLLGIEPLLNVVPGTVGMKASTASAFVACGLALLALRDPAPGRVRRRAGRILAGYVVLLGLAFLVEYSLGVDLGIDELPFRDEAGREAGIAYPGRLAPTTAIDFVLLGIALTCLDRRVWHSYRVGELLAVPVAFVAAMCLVGYAYEIPAFYGPGSAAKMAMATAATFMLLSFGIAVARPHGRLLRLMTTPDPGDAMLRRLIPLAIVMPLVLGWLRLEGAEHGLYEQRMGTWLLTTTTIAGLVVVIWHSASGLSRADRGRRQLEAQLQRLANHDHLTGLFNRGRFEEELAREMSLARRHGTPGALLVLDLDRLKVVNDELGHESGDRLLRRVAGVLRIRLRGTDPAGRIGGDEFAVYVPHASLDEAANLAETLRAEIASGGLRDSEHGAWSSASIGVAELDPTEPIDPAALLARADAAMYRAKRAGGDQVATAPAAAPTTV